MTVGSGVALIWRSGQGRESRRVIDAKVRIGSARFRWLLLAVVIAVAALLMAGCRTLG